MIIDKCALVWNFNSLRQIEVALKTPVSLLSLMILTKSVNQSLFSSNKHETTETRNFLRDFF